MDNKLTLQGYLNNPGGVGSAAISNRELVRNDLTKRFEELYNRKQDLFLGNVYKNGDDYFIHVVIPSESNDRNNTYDVVVKFSPENHSEARNTSSVNNYNVQLFSNSPSFTFTYAYVFDKEGLLVRELRDKYRDETFQPPSTRNPYEGISYEKTIFYGIMYILRNQGLLSKSILDKGRSISNLKSIVRTTDKVSIEHTHEKNRLKNLEAEAERKDKKKEVRDISIINKPKKGIKPSKIKPTKPKAKIKPSPKVTGRTSLKNAIKKRGK